MIFAFFGFYRNGKNKNFNFEIDTYDKYMFIPTLLHEHKDDLVSREELLEKYGKNSVLNLYVYNKEIHKQKALKLNVPIFINKWYQQAYRIFSFFYNIKNVLEMIPKNTNHEEIIILARSDIGIELSNTDRIEELLKNFDIIVGKRAGPGVDDKWFIFKYKNISIFTSLYNAYEEYLVNYHNSIIDKLNKIDKKKVVISTRPEDTFHFHFRNVGASFVFTDETIIKQQFEHICSKYCGTHKRDNTFIG